MLQSTGIRDVNNAVTPTANFVSWLTCRRVVSMCKPTCIKDAAGVQSEEMCLREIINKEDYIIAFR